jgi:uncharacterized protein (TIGR00725 family)
MREFRLRPKIGVMGSSNELAGQAEALKAKVNRLGQTIAERGCALITGATTGLPDLVSRAARLAGGITLGISPAQSREEHVSRYALPDDGADLIIYTGFGLKGRNVINVRASDIVIIVGGGIGTLNEFTVAFDEGKVIGVLEGSGGFADRSKEIALLSGKEVKSVLIHDSNPEALVDSCLDALARRQD